MYVYVPPATARALMELVDAHGEAFFPTLQDAMSSLLHDMTTREVRRLTSGVAQLRAADELAESIPGSLADALSSLIGLKNPTDLGFAIDTIRSLQQSGVSPAEAVDLDRVLSILLTLRG
jgi:hypothetical protein